MAIIVLQHSDAGRSGRLGLTLRDHAHRLDVRRPDKGEALPPDLDGVEGLVVLGGPQNVGEDLTWLKQEETLIRAAHDEALPVVGICLGAQIVASALGGEVQAMDRPIVGFREVRLNPVGQTDTLLAGMAWNSMQFCTHGRCVSKVPPGAQILAGSDHCACQIFKVGLRTYGFQFHFEADREIMGALLKESPDFLQQAQTSVEAVETEAEHHYASFARLGDRLSVNIATFLIPSATRLAV